MNTEANEVQAGPVAKVARDLTEILDLYAKLREQAEWERDEAREALARVVEVHADYFDTDREPGSWDDRLGSPDPEPEDVWRFDRDFRAALRGDQ